MPFWRFMTNRFRSTAEFEVCEILRWSILHSHDLAISLLTGNLMPLRYRLLTRLGYATITVSSTEINALPTWSQKHSLI